METGEGGRGEEGVSLGVLGNVRACVSVYLSFKCILDQDLCILNMKL